VGKAVSGPGARAKGSAEWEAPAHRELHPTVAHAQFASALQPYGWVRQSVGHTITLWLHRFPSQIVRRASSPVIRGICGRGRPPYTHAYNCYSREFPLLANADELRTLGRKGKRSLSLPRKIIAVPSICTMAVQADGSRLCWLC
jgi:hypothetical protein